MPTALKYGFLPGGSYPIYPPNVPIDLTSRHVNFSVSDSRSQFEKAECTNIKIERDSELEGDLGLELVSNYLTTMTDTCKGVIDTSSIERYRVELQVLSPKLKGFIFVTVYGIIQIRVESPNLNKTYCAVVKDGDPDSPLGKYAAATRREAMRQLVSAACRKAVQSLLADIASSPR